MSVFPATLFIFQFVYLLFIILVIFYVVTRVNKFFQLKQEHNQLLREILKKMDGNQNSGLK